VRRFAGSRPDRGRRARLALSALLLCAVAAHAATADKAPLDILIYGASGEVGTRLLNESLRRNHRVTAVSRDVSRIVGGRRNLEVVAGNLLDDASVRELTAGRDVVLVSVRGTVGGSRDPADTVHLLGIRQVVEALRAAGNTRTRVLIVGGAGSLEVRPGVTYAESIPRIFYWFVPGELKREIAGHRMALAFLASVDDVHWTYVSPPKRFKPGRRTGRYRLGGTELPVDRDGRSHISMEDFAVAMLDLAEAGGHRHSHLSVVAD